VRIRAATRGSALARWQTEHVADLLRATTPDVSVEPVVVETFADRRQDLSIHQIGGKGAFVKEVQAAVLDGRADLAVHSAKDLPSAPAPGLVIAGVPERADPRDALVGARLDDLPHGGHVATGSIRRQAQLAHRRPDLVFSGLRGNIQTRLEKAAGFDAVVMAVAALERMELTDRITDVLEPDVMVPQVGQGTLAVECRADDTELVELLGRVSHPPTRRVLDAERAFLAELGGDCDLPAGAHAVIVGEHVRIDGVVASADGRVLLRERFEGADGVALGHAVARRLLDRGGADLLADR
jgi:hydroxymethylbilane synthase